MRLFNSKENESKLNYNNEIVYLRIKLVVLKSR